MSEPRAVQEQAKAKINLYLHVTDRREDGYHNLCSLVMFAEHGDVITVHEADDFQLVIDGPFAGDLAQESDNLITRAAQKLASHFSKELNCHIHLEKNIPLGAGLGGGSADAAAAARALLTFWNIDEYDQGALDTLLLSLGADVPMCFTQHVAHVRGVGEIIVPLPNASAKIPALLVWPDVHASTPAIFKAYQHVGDKAPYDAARVLSACGIACGASGDDLLAFLGETQNDLYEAASTVHPEIKQALEAICDKTAAVFSRMTGSGACCFGLYERMEEAQDAASILKKAHPEWWIIPTFLGA